MTLPFSEENTISRRRLEVFIRRLSDEDLTRTTAYGWTTAALLAHLAFWDQRVLALLRRWGEQGLDSSPIDADAVNEALKPMCHALEPRAAAELCLSSASAADEALEALPAEFFERIQEQMEASSFQFRANRALHRNTHLDDLESLLG